MKAPSLQDQLYSLWNFIEDYHASIENDKTLRELDGLLCDGLLTQEAFDDAKIKLLKRAKQAKPLFGDFELLIDKYLGGEKSIKEAVNESDFYCHFSGFYTLDSFLNDIAKTGFQDDHVYKACQSDVTYQPPEYVEEKVKHKYITKHRSKWRVSLPNAVRLSFSTLERAISYRDRELGFTPRKKVKLNAD